MPANNPICISKYLSDNLNAMHAARESFIEHERSERIRQALLRKTRSFSDQVFNHGDSVYFYRNDNIWHGPAKIIGMDGTAYLLKQGGSYSRVHGCKMKLVPNVDFGNCDGDIQLTPVNADVQEDTSPAVEVAPKSNIPPCQQETTISDDSDLDVPAAVEETSDLSA